MSNDDPILIQYDYISSLFEQNQNLVRVLSHDLMTPITKLRYTAKKAIKLQPVEEQIALWNEVVRLSQIIQDITEHVKDLSAVISGKKELDLESSNILTAIDDCKSLLQERLEEKNISVNINQNCETVAILMDQKVLAYQIFGNLFSNAIKFSHENSSIDIDIKDDGTYIIIEVTDHGVGIPAALIDKVFLPEEKTSRKGTSGEKGTGFGLPIIKTYMDYSGGAIKVTSKTKEENPHDSGTTFSLRFLKA